MNQEKITKVFMTGCIRSGTTFLANYLNGVDKCVFLRDSFMAIFRASSGIKSFTEVLPIRTRNILLFNLKSEMVAKNVDKLNELTISQFSTPEELFNLAMELLIETDTKVFGVKITEEGSWFETLLVETDMKLIYLVRDLRDVLLSSANAFNTYNRSFFSQRWFRGITGVLRITDPRVLIVRFEDLILAPEKELERLSDFIGIKIDGNISELKDVSGTEWVGNSSFHDVKRLFDPVTVYRWKKNLSSREVEYGSIVYKKLMKELGYEENKLSLFKGLKIRIILFKEYSAKIIRGLFFFRLVRKLTRALKNGFSTN